MTRLGTAERRDVLRACGANGAILDALLEYGASPYQLDNATAGQPLDDEPHVPVWESYCDRAREIGAFAALRERFAQLRFPVADGMSREPAYRAATLRGEFEGADAFAPGLVIRRPDAVTLSMVASAAGRVPVLAAGDRADFEALVRAFTERNEPAEVPASMGACLVGGLINWHRIALHREQWSREAGEDSPEAWNAEFKSLISRKPLYQDRLVLLSAGPYSAVPAEECGGDAAQWPSRSIGIRREHELFHYYTYRRFGRIRTHVFDELLADFAGLVRTDGRYDARLALRFLGVDHAPAIREDGRLLNYVSERLPREAWPVAARLARRAAGTLERIATRHRDVLATTAGTVTVFEALCPLGLEELATDAAVDAVEEALQG